MHNAKSGTPVTTFLTVLMLSGALLALGSVLSVRADPVGGDDAQTLADCPPQGDAKPARVQALNRLKRRMTTPSQSDIDGSVTLEAMLAPGDDATRWDPTRAATITGYVTDVKPGGPETVNCHTTTVLYKDTHIELAVDPAHSAGRDQVIVEITPQWRLEESKGGVDWQTNALKKQMLGKRITVTG